MWRSSHSKNGGMKFIPTEYDIHPNVQRCIGHYLMTSSFYSCCKISLVPRPHPLTRRARGGHETTGNCFRPERVVIAILLDIAIQKPCVVQSGYLFSAGASLPSDQKILHPILSLHTVHTVRAVHEANWNTEALI